MWNKSSESPNSETWSIGKKSCETMLTALARHDPLFSLLNIIFRHREILSKKFSLPNSLKKVRTFPRAWTRCRLRHHLFQRCADCCGAGIWAAEYGWLQNQSGRKRPQWRWSGSPEIFFGDFIGTHYPTATIQEALLVKRNQVPSDIPSIHHSVEYEFF